MSMEQVEFRGYCSDCENETIARDGRCACGSGRVVRLSDADARIAELEETLAALSLKLDASSAGLASAKQRYDELMGKFDYQYKRAVAAEARAEAAEALLKEAGTEKTARIMSDPCVQKLEDGEPFFVMLGRDADASHALATWITLRLRSEGRTAKVKAAEKTLDAFRDCQDRRAALKGDEQ